MYAHMTPGPYASKDEFVEHFIEGMSNSFNQMLTFAIIDKSQPPAGPEDGEGALAGMVSYMNTSRAHLYTEMGFVMVLPPFQRTGVATHAVGLMLQHAFAEPESKAAAADAAVAGGAGPGGMGLRRVAWIASGSNAASVAAAQSLGFRVEGVRRWDRLNRGGRARGKVGNSRQPPEGTAPEDVWRDTIMLSLCWDDWDGGASAKVRDAMSRSLKRGRDVISG